MLLREHLAKANFMLVKAGASFMKKKCTLVLMNVFRAVFLMAGDFLETCDLSLNSELRDNLLA